MARLERDKHYIYVFLQFLYLNINNLFSYLPSTNVFYNIDMLIISNIMHVKQTHMVSCNIKIYAERQGLGLGLVYGTYTL